MTKKFVFNGEGLKSALAAMSVNPLQLNVIAEGVGKKRWFDEFYPPGTKVLYYPEKMHLGLKTEIISSCFPFKSEVGEIYVNVAGLSFPVPIDRIQPFVDNEPLKSYSQLRLDFVESQRKPR
jgi:hypothetical protein